MKQLDKRFIWLHFIKNIIGYLLLLAFVMIPMGSILWLTITELNLQISALVLFGVIMPFMFFVFMGMMYAWSYLVWHFYRYNLSQDTFNKEYGVIMKRYVSIPYARIQNVDVQRTLLDRFFGLSTIFIQTAGASGIVGSEGVLPGISKDQAFALKEELLKKVHAHETSKINNSGI